MIPRSDLPSAPCPEVGLAWKDYSGEHGFEVHPFSQIVIPVSGRAEIVIDGRSALVGCGNGAFIAEGVSHNLFAAGQNRGMILDLAGPHISPDLAERLGNSPFFTVQPAAAKLVDFMTMRRCNPGPAMKTHWLALLLDTLGDGGPRVRTRVASLCATIEARLDERWTVARMAHEAGLSASRFHAVFHEEFGQSPQAWLTGQRLKHAQAMLAGSHLSIAEIAFRSGYSDQSALCRAMQREHGVTPGAYRNKVRDFGSRIQEP